MFLNYGQVILIIVAVWIVVRLTAGLARQIDYYNSAGINTLIMKI